MSLQDLKIALERPHGLRRGLFMVISITNIYSNRLLVGQGLRELKLERLTDLELPDDRAIHYFGIMIALIIRPLHLTQKGQRERGGRGGNLPRTRQMRAQLLSIHRKLHLHL